MIKPAAEALLTGLPLSRGSNVTPAANFACHENEWTCSPSRRLGYWQLMNVLVTIVSSVKLFLNNSMLAGLSLFMISMLQQVLSAVPHMMFELGPLDHVSAALITNPVLFYFLNLYCYARYT